MEPDIQRVNAYDDPRFSPTVLRQHGAFLVNGAPCQVEITGEDSATIYGGAGEFVLPLIEDFRFYAEHICKFYDEGGGLLAEFPPVERFQLPIGEIQPSQFYVDEDKLKAVRSFIHRPEDIVIPVIRHEGRYVSLDGHTRLAAAVDAGFDSVRAFFTEGGDYILGFVEEAQKRGVRSPYDLKRVSHEEYEVVWNRFCDEFFERHSQKDESV